MMVLVLRMTTKARFGTFGLSHQEKRLKKIREIKRKKGETRITIVRVADRAATKSI